MIHFIPCFKVFQKKKRKDEPMQRVLSFKKKEKSLGRDGRIRDGNVMGTDDTHINN